jgi:hypothetical protein
MFRKERDKRTYRLFLDSFPPLESLSMPPEMQSVSGQGKSVESRRMQEVKLEMCSSETAYPLVEKFFFHVRRDKMTPHLEAQTNRLQHAITQVLAATRPLTQRSTASPGGRGEGHIRTMKHTGIPVQPNVSNHTQHQGIKNTTARLGHPLPG